MSGKAARAGDTGWGFAARQECGSQGKGVGEAGGASGEPLVGDWTHLVAEYSSCLAWKGSFEDVGGKKERERHL